MAIERRETVREPDEAVALAPGAADAVVAYLDPEHPVLDVAAARRARLPARVDAPVALLTNANAVRALAAFPKPFEPYSDPFDRLIRRG
jgi:hypothetical protein